MLRRRLLTVIRCCFTLIGIAVAATLTLAARQPTVHVKAFTHLRLIDGTDATPVADATIIVRDGRIAAIGPASRIAIPDGAERTSFAGKTVMPGLVNAHGHVGDTDGLQGDRYSAANVMRDLRLYAAYGVTTVFSLGGDQAPGFAARDSERTPTLDRARIFVAGPILDPRTPEEARRLVDEDARLKVNIVKIRVDDMMGRGKKMPPEIYRAVIDEAHARGLRVAVHLVYLEDAKGVLAAGADYIAHSIRDRDVDPEVIAALKARNVCLCPTLMRDESTFVYESTPAFFSDPFFLRHADMSVVKQLEDPTRQQQMRNSPSTPRNKAQLAVAVRNLKALSDAGVTIAMGTDTGPPGRFQGYFEQLELEMMANAGLTPRQVLAAATRDAARCMKIDDEVGTLEPGKWADFLVLNADPLADVRNTRAIDSIWIAANRVKE